MSARTAIYAGSFDPLTNGHLSVLRAGLVLFDHVTIAIGVHAGKAGLFTYDERRALIGAALDETGMAGDRVSVAAFDGLVIEAARAAGAIAMLRGLRDSTDYAYEMQMAGMNTTMAPDVETVFVPAEAETRPIAATLVRQIAAMGGDVSHFVPPSVEAALKARFSAS
ncbi:MULTISPECIES: pantetheine-phosphate adenylyltransferase [unclassified Roseitalea]|uniref:pantetheine-phosphate adenylyltransferase n=1 Tax=unclassified Roseitalea TaxID=2639107 RepID=UPI00273E0249|nr:MULTISPECIES: pantetheine-phosphate adenylyltransferase [unclassified Roseitalea]